MSATLMRFGCHECGYRVILPNDPLTTLPPEPLSAHFDATGHHLMRFVMPDDIMMPWFEVGE